MKNTKKKNGAAAKGKGRATLSAQQTIPYLSMHPDGVCKLPGGLYTKTVEYEDINYSVASTEDQTAIFSGWSSFLNYFDSSLPFQLSFINRRSHSRSRYQVNIPKADDNYNSVRDEFTGMLKNQIAKSNNGIERSKYITFGIPAEGIAEARPRLERVEADVMGNFKRLGVPSEPMDGRARLALLHSQMHPGSREAFRFSWKDIPQTGLGTKDFIAPDSLDFRQSRTFRIGQYWGAVSYLQIMASELSDKLLAEILELDAEMTVTMHIQTVDQLKAIKTIKGKISDIGKMKVEEQRKAVRSGYDPDILPPDLITFSKDAAELLADLQSRNERMFLLTFTVVNLAPTRQRLENDVFTVGGIAQKYNCALRRLDWQQEQGFVVSQAVDQNFHEGAATWCYFDEFHILLRDPLTASYFVAVWKMLRKKGCVPSALTQNVKDLLASREIENILDNTDFMILLSQAQSDRTILAKQLGISEHQLSYITHSNSGEGLLFYGNVTIPFVDRFPRGEIYDLLTTRPEDMKNETKNE